MEDEKFALPDSTQAEFSKNMYRDNFIEKRARVFINVSIDFQISFHKINENVSLHLLKYCSCILPVKIFESIPKQTLSSG